MENFVHDLRYGFRMLWKSQGFSAVAILALALGIGANTALFSVVDTLLLKALPYKDADRLVRVGLSLFDARNPIRARIARLRGRAGHKVAGH